MENIEIELIRLKTLPGCSIDDVAVKSITLAVVHKCMVNFIFNGRFITVNSKSTVTEVVEEYNQKLNNKTL